MPTDLPKAFDEEIHDFSALDAQTRAQDAKSTARKTLATGAAALMAGAGVGLAAFGLSFIVAPRIYWCGDGDQICIGDSVGPHLTGPAGRDGVNGKDGKDGLNGEAGRDGAAGRDGRDGVDGKDAPPVQQIIPPVVTTPPPATPAAPEVGDRYSPSDFQKSEAFQAAQFSGRVSGFRAGKLTFDNGHALTATFENGVEDRSITTTRYNGDFGFCSDTLTKYPNGGARWNCRVLHAGTIENPFSYRPPAPRPPVAQPDFFEELFGPDK